MVSDGANTCTSRKYWQALPGGDWAAGHISAGLRARARRANIPPVLLMTQIRKSRGLSLADVARQVGTDQANLSRVEKGAQMPKRPLARQLFRFYEGRVPLGAIYDPEYFGTESG